MLVKGGPWYLGQLLHPTKNSWSHRILWNVITYPCPRYQHLSGNMTCKNWYQFCPIRFPDVPDWTHFAMAQTSSITIQICILCYLRPTSFSKTNSLYSLDSICYLRPISFSDTKPTFIGFNHSPCHISRNIIYWIQQFFSWHDQKRWWSFSFVSCNMYIGEADCSYHLSSNIVYWIQQFFSSHE